VDSCSKIVNAHPGALEAYLGAADLNTGVTDLNCSGALEAHLL
jgi:hypothetical protein